MGFSFNIYYMPINYAAKYNPSKTPITGCTQVGNIAVSTDMSITNLSGFSGGIDDTNGYVIISDTVNAGLVGRSTKGRSGVVSSTPSIPTYWRSSLKTEASFVSLSNRLPARRYQTSFTTATESSNWLTSNGYWTSYSVSSTLGTLGNPAVSAQAIYNSGQTTNGWYYIQTSNMSSPKQIYCNMTDQGGGWMLMSYNPNNTTTTGVPYPNQWLGGTGSFTSKVSIDARQIWYHNGTAQCTQVMKLASTTASLVPLLTNVTIANKVVYNNPNNLRLSATFSTTLVNNTPMTGTWSGIKGHTLMSTDLAVNAPGDWIYSVNTWWTVCGPSSQLLADGRSANAQGSGSWTNISSNTIYGMADVSSIANSVRSDIKTYAVYIK
jgi:hypothetical protein